jgi:hypothetical protein
MGKTRAPSLFPALGKTKPRRAAGAEKDRDVRFDCVPLTIAPTRQTRGIGPEPAIGAFAAGRPAQRTCSP